jgi:hypothetical protein
LALLYHCLDKDGTFSSDLRGLPEELFNLNKNVSSHGTQVAPSWRSLGGANLQSVICSNTLYKHKGWFLKFFLHHCPSRLKVVSASQGLMLESSSSRLMEPGGPHHNCPDKEPAARLATIAAAGELHIPFTSGKPFFILYYHYCYHYYHCTYPLVQVKGL